MFLYIQLLFIPFFFIILCFYLRINSLQLCHHLLDLLFCSRHVIHGKIVVFVDLLVVIEFAIVDLDAVVGVREGLQLGPTIHTVDFISLFLNFVGSTQIVSNWPR
jgi:hypothetical protein